MSVLWRLHRVAVLAAVLAPVPAAVMAQAGSRTVYLRALQVERTEKGNSDGEVIATNVVARLEEWLLKNHTCADPLSDFDVQAMIEFDRARAQLGSRDASVLEEIAGKLGAQYAVGGSVSRLGANYHVQLSLFDMKRATVKAKITLVGETASLLGGIPEKQAMEFFKPVRECPLKLVVSQNLRSDEPRIVGRIAGEIPLEMNGDGDVEGDGALEATFVPILPTDEATRAATVRSTLQVKVEGRREQGAMKLTIRGTGGQLSAGGRQFGGAGVGDMQIALRARAGAEYSNYSTSIGGYKAMVTYTLLAR